MKFYSGFSLKNDKSFFQEFLCDSEYTVAVFSYGAIKAFQYTAEELKNARRVDTLQLFSPAFFQTKSEKFKKLQLMSFKHNTQSYLKIFTDSCFSPYLTQKLEYSESSYKDLEELLCYEWSLSYLKKLENFGVKIEIYLGEKDIVIDVEGANNFFLDIGTVTFVKNANHFLQIN